MGMFLSKYSMLSALGYGDDSYVLPETIKILDKYKLFGLIIHDPNVHSEFNNKLSQIFERLDYLTGPDFLFFCLIDPPLKWKKRVDRDYFGIWEPEKLLDPNNAYSTTDESISAYSLAQSLGISFDDLPVIILTNDFRLNEYRFIKTSEAFLEDQLKEIGMFSSQKQKHFDLKNDSELNNLIKSIDFCGRTELMKMEYSLAKNLSDYISFVIADTSAHDSKKANKQSRIVIRNFLSNTNKIIDSNEIDSLNIGFLGKLANINMRHFYSEHMLFENANVKEERAEYSIISKPIDSDIVIPNLESESRALYRIYKKVMPIFSQLLIEDSTEEFEDIDYTPLVICLSKIFEIEINLSVVTWIRKYLNIEMPQYFNKHKLDSNNYTLTPSEEIIPNARPIDFNKGNGGKWFPPGIGESELIIKSLFNQGYFPTTVFHDFSKFINSWTTIRKYRNKATHTDLINENQFFELNSTFDFLRKEEYF